MQNKCFYGIDGAALLGVVAGATGRAGETTGFNIAREGEADGYYIHLGYRIKPNIELDLRYDELNGLTDNNNGEREFTTTTVGMQYFFNKKSRLKFEFQSCCTRIHKALTKHLTNFACGKGVFS